MLLSENKPSASHHWGLTLSLWLYPQPWLLLLPFNPHSSKIAPTRRGSPECALPHSGEEQDLEVLKTEMKLGSQ